MTQLLPASSDTGLPPAKAEPATSVAGAARAQVAVPERALRLAHARQLLDRAGVHLSPDLPEGSDAWLQAMVDALCALSSTDPLTGLVNRRQFEATMDGEVDRVARSGETALLLLADIDHFKRINDTYGHGAGDLVIQAVARSLLQCVRPMDTVGRLGGEEFGIVLPNCPPTFAQTVAERIRAHIEQMAVAVNPSTVLRVSISIGGAFAPQWVRSSRQFWYERADQQLYRAKAGGRNRACLESPTVSEVSAEERDLLFASAFMPDDSILPT